MNVTVASLVKSRDVAPAEASRGEIRKKSALIAWFLFLGLFPIASSLSVAKVTLFGPKQYVRTSGALDLYSDMFAGESGRDKLRSRKVMGDSHTKVEVEDATRMTLSKAMRRGRPIVAGSSAEQGLVECQQVTDVQDLRESEFLSSHPNGLGLEKPIKNPAGSWPP